MRSQSMTTRAKERRKEAEAGRPKRQGTPGMTDATARLTRVLDIALRRAALYRGDMARIITEAVNGVDLLSVKAVDLEKAGELMSPTTFVIEQKVYDRLKRAAKERGTSMNLLINSALAHRFRITGTSADELEGQEPPQMRRSESRSDARRNSSR